MIEQVVVLERLLDHHQIELVERRQVRRVRQRVGGVGVDHQGDRAEPLAQARDGLDVPPRLDLDLDALVSVGALGRDAILELLERVLDANRHAGRHRPAAAAKHLPERHALLLRVQVPRGHLDRRLRHVVAAHARQRRPHARRMGECAPDDQRRQKLGDDVPDGLGGLAAVVRIGVGDRLAPAIDAVAAQAHEDERAVVGSAEARLEEAHERQAKQSNFQAVDCHGRVDACGECRGA